MSAITLGLELIIKVLGFFKIRNDRLEQYRNKLDNQMSRSKESADLSDERSANREKLKHQ